RCLLGVFELFLPLQGFDEGFLREVLRVMDVAHHAINLQENAPHVLGDKTLLKVGGHTGDVRIRRRMTFVHQYLWRESLHSPKQHDAWPRQTWRGISRAMLSIGDKRAAGGDRWSGENAFWGLPRQGLANTCRGS